MGGLKSSPPLCPCYLNSISFVLPHMGLGILDNFLLFIILTLSFSPLLSYHFFILSKFTRSAFQSQTPSSTSPTIRKETPEFYWVFIDEAARAQWDQQNNDLSLTPHWTHSPRCLGEECVPERGTAPGRVVRVAGVVIKHFDLVTRCLLNYEWL